MDDEPDKEAMEVAASISLFPCFDSWGVLEINNLKRELARIIQDAAIMNRPETECRVTTMQHCNKHPDKPSFRPRDGCPWCKIDEFQAVMDKLPKYEDTKLPITIGATAYIVRDIGQPRECLVRGYEVNDEGEIVTLHAAGITLTRWAGLRLYSTCKSALKEKTDAE